MDQLKLIVYKLNGEPFNRNLRLVDLDGQSQDERLQILDDVFAKLGFDVGERDARQEAKEERTQRMAQYLTYLKYKDIPPSASSSFIISGRASAGSENTAARCTREQWLDSLGDGKKDTVYSILYWILSDYDRLCKRAYLSQYLVPVDVPGEVTTVLPLTTNDGRGVDSRSTLVNLSEQYKELQSVFKEVHINYESKRAQTEGRFNYKAEIRQLDQEKAQLTEKIEKLRKATKEKKRFSELLQTTSQMRKEKDNEVQLNERMVEQKHLLQVSEQTFLESKRQLQALHGNASSSSNGYTEDFISGVIRQNIDDKTKTLQTYLMSDRKQLQEKMDLLEREALEPVPTLDDIEHLKSTITQLEAEFHETKAEVDRLVNLQGTSELEMYRQVRKVLVAPSLIQSSFDSLVEAYVNGTFPFLNSLGIFTAT